MPNYRDLYIKSASLLATVSEELDKLSATIKEQQQEFESVIIEKEPPNLKLVPLCPQQEETEQYTVRKQST